MINDLINFRASENDELRQSYGNYSFNSVSLRDVTIPVRVMLAELYLWRGSYTGSQADYEAAVRMYHDYFTFPSEEVSIGNSVASWPICVLAYFGTRRCANRE
jgi:hypothetical protein